MIKSEKKEKELSKDKSEKVEKVEKVKKVEKVDKAQEEELIEDLLEEKGIESIEQPPLTLAILEGAAEFKISQDSEWVAGFDAQPIEQGWSVRTLNVSSAVLNFPDGSMVLLEPNTEVTIELFQIIRTEGIAGIWEYIKEQFNDLKETVIDSIQEMIISTVVDAGIKWVLGLMSPAGAFVKAAMMIIDIVKFFIERGSQIMELINAFIDGIKAVASGNVGIIAQKIETALGKAIPVIIGFLASLLGISGLAQKVQKLIGKIRKRIDKAIDKLILKAKKAFSKLVRKGKAAAGKFVDWLGIKKRFKTKDGKNHKLFLEETGGKTELVVQSEKQLVGVRLIKAKQETQAMPDGETKTKRIAAEGRIDTYLSETRAILQKIKTEEKKPTPNSSKIEGWKSEIEQKFTSIAGDLETIGVEPGTVGTGDNGMLQEIGKQYVTPDHKTKAGSNNGTDTFLSENGYHYATSASGKIYIRRKEAKENVPQLSFDIEGKLQLGGSSSSSEAEHKNYIPDKITRTETGMGYEVVYTTLTDTGEKGPNFQINISHAGVLAANEDENITRHVSGRNLKLKATGGARGVTDSATGGFHNAHLIADRFGGSGSNSAENIHPSTPRYNTKEMKSKEDAIARILESGSKDQNNFNLDVSANIVKEKSTSAGLLAALNEEAKKFNIPFFNICICCVVTVCLHTLNAMTILNISMISSCSKLYATAKTASFER